MSALQSAGLQLGWKAQSKWWQFEWNWGAFVAKLAGLLVSVFAVSLGAPFWFDMLNRFMQVRAAGGKERGAAAPREPGVSAAARSI